ncbi:MAG: hypothetical protein ACLU0O_12885 [Collinsella sp.]
MTLTLGVTVFYAFNTISMQVDIAGIDEEGLAQVMGSMLGDLTYFWPVSWPFDGAPITSS